MKIVSIGLEVVAHLEKMNEQQLPNHLHSQENWGTIRVECFRVFRKGNKARYRFLSIAPKSLSVVGVVV
jgi:hypothetical protein